MLKTFINIFRADYSDLKSFFFCRIDEDILAKYFMEFQAVSVYPENFEISWVLYINSQNCSCLSNCYLEIDEETRTTSLVVKVSVFYFQETLEAK